VRNGYSSSLIQEELLLGGSDMENKCPKDVDEKSKVSDEYLKDVTPLTQEQIDKLLTEISSKD